MYICMHTQEWLHKAGTGTYYDCSLPSNSSNFSLISRRFLPYLSVCFPVHVHLEKVHQQGPNYPAVQLQLYSHFLTNH